MTNRNDAVGRMRLNRAAWSERNGSGGEPAPVRIVHQGLGAFHRAHQACFTAQVDDTHEWGIAAFTGRSAKAAEELAPQDGLFSLMERSAEGDSVSVVSSIVEAWDGARLDKYVPLIAAASTAIVTLTITEPGYRLNSDGSPNLEDAAVTGDLDWLRTALNAVTLDYGTSGPQTALGRLVLGLEARRRAGSGSIAVVPCDNMPGNGALVASGVIALARVGRAETAEWIRQNVSFVSTSVDRITPRTTPADVAVAAELSGWEDSAPVVTEPFKDWVLSGSFPAGRPAWERAGASFVENIEPFEQRKLWLLNGSHSLLAYAGLMRGHETVAAAIADPVCREWVNELWDEAARHLSIEPHGVDEYRDALLGRFENSRIEHRLSQIAMEGVNKLRVRIAPIILAERETGRAAAASARAIGAWASALLSGQNIPDAENSSIAKVLNSAEADRLGLLIGLIDDRLARDPAVLDAVRDSVAAFADRNGGGAWRRKPEQKSS